VRFCYIDETGLDGKAATAVMVGVVCDGRRLTRAQNGLGELFSADELKLLRKMRELKGRDLYRGKKKWGKVDGEARSDIIDRLVGWAVEEKHKLVLSALKSGKAAPLKGIDTWRSLALHLVLQLQREGQKRPQNKGRAVVVFDENKMQVDRMAELLAEPPPWTDDYYGRVDGNGRLDQVIDSAFTAKSHHVDLLQLADLYAYLFFRYEELASGRAEEYWPGERAVLDERIAALSGRLIEPQHRWAKRTGSECMRWYVRKAPESLVNLGR